MTVIGIDPGLSGAIAIFRPDVGALVIHDAPTLALSRGGKSKRELDAVELARLIDAAGPIGHAFVEAVGAMPGQGVSSVFSFGKSYGLVLGILAANFVPLTLVAPVRWKRFLGVPADNDGARARASQLMPAHAGLWTRVRDDGRAEAALLAYYWPASRKMTGADLRSFLGAQAARRHAAEGRKFPGRQDAGAPRKEDGASPFILHDAAHYGAVNMPGRAAA